MGPLVPTLALAAAPLPCPLLRATTGAAGGGEHQLLREGGQARKCDREPQSQAFPSPSTPPPFPLPPPAPPSPSFARQKAQQQQRRREQQQPPTLDCTFRVVAACFMVAEGKEGADREEERRREKRSRQEIKPFRQSQHHSPSRRACCKWLQPRLASGASWIPD